jgi:uncharacterized protein
MIVEFRFKNFKSFKDEAVLNFVASSDKKLPENLFVCPDDKSAKLLSTSAIYGPNASGKSTVFQAFEFAREFIKASTKSNPDARIKVSPFLLDDSRLKPSQFEFTFIAKGVRYQYGFAVNNRMVDREWLISYPKGRPRKLFERFQENKKTVYEFGSSFKGEKDKLKELTRPNVLFLSVGAAFNNKNLLDIYRWFVDNTSSVGTNDIPEPIIFDFIMEHPNVIGNLKGLIKYADLGIVDFALSKKESGLGNYPEDLPESIRKAIEAFNKAIEDSGDENIKFANAYDLSISHKSGNETFAFPWESESDGTRRLFGLSAPIFDALETGKVLFVDEIDRSLHPLLARKLIQLFQNRKTNPKNAQLVFNTHDTSLLSAGLLRRDQVWFLEKDQKGSSHIYSLLDYSPRKDESLEKGYLQGRYGAVPFFGEYTFGEN